MKRFKYQAYLDEFPALADICAEREGAYCESIKIRRMTPELLVTIPHITEHTGSLVDIYEGDEAWLVSNEGVKGVDPEYHFNSNYAHTSPRYDPGESILEACDRHTTEPELIFWIEFGLGAVDHRSTKYWKATVYKPSKDGETIEEMIAEARAKAIELVKAETAF